MQKFSYYKGGIKKLTPAADITIERAVEIIKSDTYKEQVEKMRAVTDPSIYSVLKKDLDYFTFSGTFKKRHTGSLIKHSGYLCIDLDPYRKNKAAEPELINPRLIDPDEFSEVREEIIQDPLTMVCFISPGGNGLKVIFHIDATKHTECFHEIEAYYKEKYALIFDKGVHDVARACFVSYDPIIYYNPQPTFYKLKGGISPKNFVPISEVDETVNNDKKLSPSEQFKRNKDLIRAEFVVDQVEKNKIDLTGGYDDWQLIAFSLVTFGPDDGRRLWHRVSRQYSEYEYQEADDKFTNALQTRNKIKNAAKFFSIAKDYGLDVRLPKTIAEAQDEITYKDIIGDEEMTDDFLKYGIYENQGFYWGLDMKNKKYPISNFKMRILYHVRTSDEEAFRLIQIKNIFGLDCVVKMNTDDFVSVGSFKKVVARQGNFIWKGTDADLCKLQDKLQRDERPTELIKQLGYNKRNNFYAWANGIYDCNADQFVPIDEHGIIEHFKVKDGERVPHNFFIPALSKIFIEKDDLYVNDKRFVFLEREDKFSDWAKLYCAVYREHGELTMIFYIMALFSDIVFTDMGDRIPMLNIYGQKSTGKGAIIQSLMKLFGKGQKQLMLGGASTVVGFMRKSGQYSNALVWLDEYKNNLKPMYIESIKNLYDRIGYERGKKDNTFQTESTSIDSAVIVSGQEMPIIEEALFSRFIQIVAVKPPNDDKSQQLYNALKEMEADGLGCITVYLLKYRDYIKQNFKQAYNDEERALTKKINDNEVIPRFTSNYAALIAICKLISDKESLPFNTVGFRELCRKALLEQHYILKGSDTIGKFWSIVEGLFNQDIIREGNHFILKNGNLYIRIQDIYQHYAEMMQKRRDPSALDEATLKNYLEHDPKSFIRREKKFFGGAQRWCFTFKYLDLGIDLIKANSKEELRSKYLEMGITMEEDESDQVKTEISESVPPIPAEESKQLTFKVKQPGKPEDPDDDLPF